MTDVMEPVCLRAPEVRTNKGFELRDVDSTADGSMIEGLAVPYSTWTDVGWFMESFAPGAFARSIKETRDLPLLLWHENDTFPVGAAHRWVEGDDGLRGQWRMDVDDELAVEAVRKAKGGFLSGLSVGFAPIAQDTVWDEKDLMWVTRTEARLLEVSLTPTPAYAGARVSLVRSRVPHPKRPVQLATPRRSAELDQWKSYLEGVKR